MQPCLGKTEMFFSSGGPEIFLAKRKCATCEIEIECRDLGLALTQRTGSLNGTGIYGGLTEQERRTLKGTNP